MASRREDIDLVLTRELKLGENKMGCTEKEQWCSTTRKSLGIIVYYYTKTCIMEFINVYQLNVRERSSLASILECRNNNA